jgi:hypothetical protein
MGKRVFLLDAEARLYLEEGAKAEEKKSDREPS